MIVCAPSAPAGIEIIDIAPGTLTDPPAGFVVSIVPVSAPLSIE